MVDAPLPHTRLCDLVGIEHPLVQAPMAGGITTPELVAAVSNAGGLGMLAGSSLPPDQLLLQLDAVRALMDRPFGVNFLIAPPEALTADATAVQGFLDRFRSELDLPAGSPRSRFPRPTSSKRSRSSSRNKFRS